MAYEASFHDTAQNYASENTAAVLKWWYQMVQYISLHSPIFCIIEYVTNKTLNLDTRP